MTKFLLLDSNVRRAIKVNPHTSTASDVDYAYTNASTKLSNVCSMHEHMRGAVPSWLNMIVSTTCSVWSSCVH